MSLQASPDAAAVESASGPPTSIAEQHALERRRRGFLGLAIGSLGVVFGDIGTSPLYAFQAAMGQASKGPVVAETAVGVVSLAIWALILVVTVKYVLFVMRADNKGEGGVLSLMALAQRAIGARTRVIFFLGLVGAALFYGDAVITPAISVLGAFQGLQDVPQLHHAAGPHLITSVSAVLLFFLFLIQSRGTATVARWFSPVMLVWFAAIAILGVRQVVAEPRILWAFSPHHAVLFMARHGLVGFLVLGSVFLTVTGAEALYADMGHFGRWPIQAAWLFIALPCLTLNYLGQGAFVIQGLEEAARHHHALFVNHDWFFVIAPPQLRWPLVILAVMASVIASQAVISGAYSLTQQAMLLGLVPRMEIRRTSETQSGQIFMPQINRFLLIGVMVLVLVFQSADNLTDAYGLAVTGTMLATTVLAFIVARRLWRWRLLTTLLLIAPLITLDTIFLAANGLKILTGGWVPLAIGTSLAAIMITWVRGAQILTDKTRRDSIPMRDLIGMLRARPPARAAGTAVFLTSDPELAPVALMHNLKHNKVLHEKNVLMTVRTTETPRVGDDDRIEIERITPDFTRVQVSYGFMERPNIPHALQLCRRKGLKFDIMSTSFFLGRRALVPAQKSKMPGWQDKLFIFLMKNAANPTDFFRIPPGRVVELGTQVMV
ncbi:MAG TPA: potassium transporter Kup [Caulobacteraceae bacterium]|nr:potassium transporter Kup [Caulobacteraceae bacterium]